MKAHRHFYVDHPKWSTHVACETCGFAIPKTMLRSAVDSGARASASLIWADIIDAERRQADRDEQQARRNRGSR